MNLSQINSTYFGRTGDIMPDVKAFIFTIMLFFLFCGQLYAQEYKPWISYFSTSDQETLSDLKSQIEGVENSLSQDYNTFNIDSLIESIVPAELNESTLELIQKRLDKQYDLGQIYLKYINGTEKTIDSVPDYKISLEFNLEAINEEMNALPDYWNNLQASYDKASTLTALTTLHHSIKRLNQNSRQFFTFYNIANKAHLIKSNEAGNSTAETQLLKKEETANNNDLIANVIINDKVVESILISIENYEEDTLLDITNLTSFDFENLMTRWNNYVYEPEQTVAVENNESAEENITGNTYEETTNDSEKTETSSVKQEGNNEQENINSTDTNQKQYDAPPKKENNISATESNYQPIVTENQKEQENYNTQSNLPVTGVTESAGELIFRVQIAASRKPLNNNNLEAIYKGPRQVKMFQEEDWYKYYIADSKSFKEAALIKKESQVDDAFIMAYQNGKKVQYYLKYVRVKDADIPQTNFVDLKSISTGRTVVVVQVAADRNPLNSKELKEIYNGDKPINYIFENGWHKYSFGIYERFWPANFARRECDVPGAFVVAYRNGEKIDLWAKTESE